MSALNGDTLLETLAAVPARERDRVCEELLGIAAIPPGTEISTPDRIGYSPCSVAEVVRMVFEVPLRQEDVFVDVGSGLGKACLLVHLLSRAQAVGVEVQEDLVRRARESARVLGLSGVSFVAEDAATADFGEGNVFFLYVPFTGELLEKVLQRIEAIAQRKPIVVCALGLDLPPSDWLTPRATEAFWLTIYDSHAPRIPVPQSPLAQRLTDEWRG